MNDTRLEGGVRMIGQAAAPAGPQIAPEQRRAMAMQLTVTLMAKREPLTDKMLIDTARSIEAYLRGDHAAGHDPS